jgi:AraC-like DNA-binding protein
MMAVKVETHAPRSDTLERHRRAIRNVIEVMWRDPSAPVDLEALAAAAYMSRYHFLRVFEDVTSISPARFLAALRMHQAKRLLLETTLAVTSICFEVGYNSLGTFTRLFTDSVGVNPSSFRKLGEVWAGRSLEALTPDKLQGPLRSGPTISGSVRGPADFHGVIFLGAFSSPIPHQRPVNGSLLLHQGRFELALERGGRYRCLLAAGFAANSDGVDYLLPSLDKVLVASTLLGCGGESLEVPALVLRPAEPFDPPILTALPILLEHHKV